MVGFFLLAGLGVVMTITTMTMIDSYCEDDYEHDDEEYEYEDDDLERN